MRFVRYMMKDSQARQVGTCPGPFDGCDFIDSSELEVHGSRVRNGSEPVSDDRRRAAGTDRRQHSQLVRNDR